MSAEPKFYVYRIFDGFETVYIGKGSGRRLSNQTKAFNLPGEIIEDCRSDDHAFEREVHWIKALQPTENVNAGGFGGRVSHLVSHALLNSSLKSI